MKKPKITIVTIAYNCAGEIEDTIKSVIAQQYDNKEYIIIDGLSTDGTMEVVNIYKKYITISTFSQPRNWGNSSITRSR